jgi:hypothetical protein
VGKVKSSTIVVFIFIVAWCFSASNVKSQNLPEKAPQVTGPSLTETLDWIKGQLEEYVYLEPEPSSELIMVFRPISFGQCTLSWKTELYAEDVYMIVSQYRVSLFDLNPSNVSVSQDSGAWRVGLHTTSNKRLIRKSEAKSTRRPKRLGPPYNVQECYIYAKDEGIAHRLAKAFEHAITICGGKQDPF